MTHADGAQSTELHANPGTRQTIRRRWAVAEQIAEFDTCRSAHSESSAAGLMAPGEILDGEEESGNMSRAEANAVLRKIIGERFMEARRINGWGQEEAAMEKFGYTNSTQLSLIEQGKRLPPHEVMIKASEIYAVSMDYLCGVSEEFERDAKLAARSAVFRRVERLLKLNTETVAECLLDACGSPGADELRVSRFASRAHALCDAVGRFEKLNAHLFEDARAGATLVRTCREMRDALQQVDRYLARAEHSRTHALQRAREVTQARRQPAGAPL